MRYDDLSIYTTGLSILLSSSVHISLITYPDPVEVEPCIYYRQTSIQISSQIILRKSLYASFEFLGIPNRSLCQDASSF